MDRQPEEDPVRSYFPVTERPDHPWVYVPPGDLCSESYRLSTFAKMDYSASTYSVSKLAQAGFFYTGYRDRVKCFSCQHSMEDWMQGAHVRHLEKHLLSGCPAKQKRENRNIVSNIIYRGADAKCNSSNHNMILKVGPGTPKSHKKLLSDLDMTKESDRLKTFKRWPSYPAPNLPSDLAKNGFFYLGNLDRVQCFSCGGVLRNWHLKDNAQEIHRRFLPHCGTNTGPKPRTIKPMKSVATGEETRNVKIAVRPDDTTALQHCELPPDPSVDEQEHLEKYLPCRKPGVPSKSSLESRIQSFAKWPANRLKAEQLAKAGFFYLGGKDEVKCFYCNGGLQKWNDDDEPWGEHAKWFPECEHVLRQKGKDFVRSITENYPNLNRPAIKSPVPVDSIPRYESSERPDVEAEDHIYVPPGDDRKSSYRLATIGAQAISNPIEAKKWANAGFMSSGKQMELMCNKCGAVIPELGHDLNVGHLPHCTAVKESKLGRDEKILADFFKTTYEAHITSDISVHLPESIGRIIAPTPSDSIHH